MSRRVVVLQGAGSTLELDTLIAAQNWEIRRATRLDEVSAAGGESDCSVGIAVFDEALICSPGDFMRIDAPSDMEWLAVIPKEAPRDPRTARALASVFFDFHTLPLDGARLLHSLGHAYGKSLLRRAAFAPPIRSRGQYGMIGDSPGMQTLYRQLERVMRASAPLLLTGESGVGKELAARAVHGGSEQAAGPFVPVNCGALPQALIESLLFGHERGSFTGAHERQIGSIEAADHGTIFLDEIGDLPRPAQASLLRFLQESTVTRVGSTRELRIDARVIAATHKDLSAAVRAGEFREDLFYRLNVLHIEIPPLRARGADSVLLAEHFLHREIIGCQPGVRGFSEAALAAIQHHSWPGNIRELLNKVQHAVVMCNGPLITPTDLQLERRGALCVSGSLADARAGTERQLIEIALDRSGHNIAATARELGVSRVTLYRILKRLGMSPRGRLSALDS